MMPRVSTPSEGCTPDGEKLQASVAAVLPMSAIVFFFLVFYFFSSKNNIDGCLGENKVSFIS